jgi:hypothetical protein
MISSHQSSPCTLFTILGFGSVVFTERSSIIFLGRCLGQLFCFCVLYSFYMFNYKSLKEILHHSDSS